DALLRNPSEIVNGHIQGGAFAIFGNASLTSLNLNALQGSQGFKITTTAALGKSLDSIATVSDFNGDGYDDFLIGAPTYGTSGQAYLVLGRASAPGGSIALAPGSGVFAITGKSIASFGQDVADAGDLNGDGYNDIIISGSGQAEIIYGRKGATMPSLLNGANAIAIGGPFAASQSVGDLNGDGYDDLVLQFNGYSDIYFGTAAKFDSNSFGFVNGTNAFRITDKASFAGDINADGYDDLIVTSYDPSAGYAAAIIYGHAGGSQWVVVTTQLNSNQALLLERDDPNAITSLIEAAGDTNGDGFDDILIGTFVPGESQQLYHVQGADFRDEIDSLGTSGADSLVGSATADRIVAAQGNDTVLGGGGADVINAGQGNDELHVGDNKFFRIDGGAGIDTLHLDYAGAIDLANLDGNKAISDRGRISNVEILDVANGFANNLTLHLADVLDLDVTIANVGGKATLDNVLRIDGEAGDTLHMFRADGWGAASLTSLAGYAVYSYQAVKIAVDTDIAVSLS
ncbi:MAG TPA: FG-GAP-like repeat-containing protein, partial [Dongiaceae bacterium]|nr:FG-GAP-like repeat-containing protein [Dongiaceae bacterium]